MRLFHDWLRRKDTDAEILAKEVDATFSSAPGQITWDYLMSIYFSVSPSNDPIQLAGHNGARALIQELIEKRDQVHNPDRYKAKEVIV